MPSLGTYIIPANAAGGKCRVNFDLMSSDISLLLSKDNIRKAEVRIHLGNDPITWKGVEFKAVPTSEGHLCISLLPDGPPAEIFNVDENREQTNEDRYTTLFKLHTQFGHVCNKS